MTYPEIARMQTTAIMEAAIEVCEEERGMIQPEIMIPLVGEVKELAFVKKSSRNGGIGYQTAWCTSRTSVGTMIEIPRAA